MRKGFLFVTSYGDNCTISPFCQSWMESFQTRGIDFPLLLRHYPQAVCHLRRQCSGLCAARMTYPFAIHHRESRLQPNALHCLMSRALHKLILCLCQHDVAHENTPIATAASRNHPQAGLLHIARMNPQSIVKNATSFIGHPPTGHRTSPRAQWRHRPQLGCRSRKTRRWSGRWSSFPGRSRLAVRSRR